ncbi:AglZ/HisF2 family acetamidino modification protein [Pseudomonas sp. CDFA 553]|uniref:AglZ/HisF2 family acetamidino modification protein n=1 Tax=Pseudomonas quasicaspiana TaxID=2829821 RepID=UPI0022285B81|nr:AglZ/HisF2 family acetamidino modification protein [Pseudomonas quasicaspiana]MCD5987021.1 AglZ/HisF2 family acetamidino modification protein [Pseudomonas quasicaspiana]
MLRPRIIPCLLIQDGGLVKTVRFKEPKYVGDPINAVKIFNEKEADELIVIDIDATVNNREPDYKRIANLAAECRMPLCYGGGVRTPEQARAIIALGVEKVAISAAALEDPSLVTRISAEVGSQSVVVVLDHKQRMLSRQQDVWTHNGTRNTKRSVLDVAREMEAAGAGEIVINSIDNDGKMKGYDIALATQLREAVSIPITILGGGGSLEDMHKVVAACGVVGVAAGSFFVFKGTYRAVLISYPSAQQKDDQVFSAITSRQ